MRYTFGEAVDDDDVLVVQGKEYRMQPLGMRAMRRMLTLRNKLIEKDALGPTDTMSTDALDLAVDIIVGSVRPEEQDRLKAHIDDSVPPGLLSQIAQSVMSAMSDLDPTQPASSSPGSPPVEAGSDSTVGAEPAVSTPSI